MIFMKYVFCFLIFCCLGGLGCWGQELRTGTYPDGSVRYKGYFSDGRPVGKMVRYYPDGKVQAEMEYRGDTVESILYSRDGKYMSTGKYVNKLKTGVWKFLKGDDLLAEENYRNNVLDGESLSYFQSGEMAGCKTWRNGKPDGGWKLYYENGQLRLQACYHLGKIDGEVRSYDQKGVLRVQGKYRNDRKEGKWEFYDEKGELLKVKIYHNGVAEDAAEEETEESRKLDEMMISGKEIPDPAVFADDPEAYMRLTGMK